MPKTDLNVVWKDRPQWCRSFLLALMEKHGLLFPYLEPVSGTQWVFAPFLLPIRADVQSVIESWCPESAHMQSKIQTYLSNTPLKIYLMDGTFGEYVVTPNTTAIEICEYMCTTNQLDGPKQNYQLCFALPKGTNDPLSQRWFKTEPEIILV
jgi:hypothetical protein